MLTLPLSSRHHSAYVKYAKKGLYDCVLVLLFLLLIVLQETFPVNIRYFAKDQKTNVVCITKHFSAVS